MWRGLGQRLKDLAEDLTTPPFVDEEDDEQEERVHREKTQPPPARAGSYEMPSQHHAHYSVLSSGEESRDKRVETNDNAFLFPSSAEKRTEEQQLPSPVPAASAPLLGNMGELKQSQPAPLSPAPLSPAPSVAAAAYGPVPPTSDVSPPTHDVFSSRRLEDELNLATPATGSRVVVPPRAAVQKVEATLQSSPALSLSPSTAAQERTQEVVSSLREQVSRLEADKKRMQDDVNRYQEQVKKSHEETVAYYEHQLTELKELVRKKDGEIASLREKMVESEQVQSEGERNLAAKEVKQLRAHQEALESEMELLRAGASEREKAFAEERTKWERQLAEAQTKTDDLSHLLSCAGETTVSLEKQTADLQKEVIILQEKLRQEQQSTPRANARAEDVSSRCTAPLLSTPADERTSNDPMSSEGELEKLLAAKDTVIQNLKDQMDVIVKSRDEMEKQLNQLSDGYIELDNLVEKERSAHKQYMQEHDAQLTQSAEKSSHYAARLTELEQQLEHKEEALRLATTESTLAARPPAVQPSTPPRAEEGATISTERVQELERMLAHLEGEKESLLARVAELQNSDNEKQQKLAQLQDALSSAEQLAAEETQKNTEQRTLMEAELRDRLAEKESVWQEAQQTAVAQARQQALEEAGVPDAAISPAVVVELEALREEKSVLKRSVGKLAEELEDLTRQKKEAAAEHEKTVVGLREERDTIAERLAKAEHALQKSEDDRKAERNRQQSGNVSVESLQARVRLLEEECQHTDDVIAELQRTVVDCLTRNNNAVSSGDDGGQEHLFDARASKRYSFSDWVLTMATALERTASVARKSSRVQGEWERTYEEARKVNETLRQQLDDTWGSIGRLQEEISVKDEQIRELERRVRASEEVVGDAEQKIVRLTNEVAALREDGVESNYHHGRSPSSVGLSAPQQQEAEALAVQLQAEADSLRLALQEREEELSVAQRSMENVNEVLESFKASRAREVAERTADLQLEIDQLRAQLGASSTAKEDFARELDAVKEDYERQLAGKNVDITSLHRKLSELRKALENAAKQLNGESSIDKRVVSHCLVNFIHGFVSQRKETDEMLKVLSSLLSWDEDMEERVGLLPGPLNPQPPQQAQGGGGGGAKRGGLLSWVRGSGSVTATGNASRSASSGGGGKNQTHSAEAGQASLAAMWVDFLVRESEQRAAEGDALTTETATGHPEERRGSESFSSANLTSTGGAVAPPTATV